VSRVRAGRCSRIGLAVNGTLFDSTLTLPKDERTLMAPSTARHHRSQLEIGGMHSGVGGERGMEFFGQFWSRSRPWRSGWQPAINGGYLSLRTKTRKKIARHVEEVAPAPTSR
jgi:hypothetical protein